MEIYIVDSDNYRCNDMVTKKINERYIKIVDFINNRYESIKENNKNVVCMHYGDIRKHKNDKELINRIMLSRCRYVVFSSVYEDMKDMESYTHDLSNMCYLHRNIHTSQDMLLMMKDIHSGMFSGSSAEEKAGKVDEREQSVRGHPEPGNGPERHPGFMEILKVMNNMLRALEDSNRFRDEDKERLVQLIRRIDASIQIELNNEFEMDEVYRIVSEYRQYRKKYIEKITI